MGFTASTTVRFRDQDYRVARHGDAWAIEVAGGWYFLTANDDPDRGADRFIDARLRNSAIPRLPGFLASARYPLLLTIDDVQVRAMAGQRLSREGGGDVRELDVRRAWKADEYRRNGPPPPAIASRQ